MSKFTDRNNWFELWEQDVNSIRSAKLQNMNADLEAGYNPYGNCILNQLADYNAYCEKIKKTLESFRTMTEKEVEHWCFYDMKARGSID